MKGYFVVDEPRSGAWNMALDRVLASYARDHAACVVRVYTWDVPTLSLGYFQPYPTVEEQGDVARLAIVRRETGGGAIVHDQDVTYSIALPDSSNKGHASHLYQVVHRAFVEWLKKHGVDSSFFSDGVPVAGCDANNCNNSRFLCFERRSDFDLVIDGYKILGSAQRRQSGSIMQHGSLLLAQSLSAPQLLGVGDLLAKSGSGHEAARFWNSGSRAWRGIQIELQQVLATVLGNEFGVQWEPTFPDFDSCLRVAGAQVQHFESFEWSQRIA
jgi:lipoate-protein ligase A